MRTAFVSSTGNDATAALNNPSLPFQTPDSALSALEVAYPNSALTVLLQDAGVGGTFNILPTRTYTTLAIKAFSGTVTPLFSIVGGITNGSKGATDDFSPGPGGEGSSAKSIILDGVTNASVYLEGGNGGEGGDSAMSTGGTGGNGGNGGNVTLVNGATLSFSSLIGGSAGGGGNPGGFGGGEGAAGIAGANGSIL